MIYSNLQRREKTAVIRSFILIIMADAPYGNISSQQERFLMSILVRMHSDDDELIIQESMQMNDFVMVDIIKRFNESDKAQIGSSWVAAVLQSRGRTGYIELDSFPKDAKIIKLLAQECNIRIPRSITVNSEIFL